MTQHRKHRGYETQRIVAHYLRLKGWPHCYAIGAGESGDDIQGTLDISVEVKARTGFSPLAAIRQMQARRTSALPFAVLRMNGTGESTIDDWPVVVRLEDMVALLRAAGYGDTQPTTEPLMYRIDYDNASIRASVPIVDFNTGGTEAEYVEEEKS